MWKCTKSRYFILLAKSIVPIQLDKICSTHDDCFDQTKIMYYFFLSDYVGQVNYTKSKSSKWLGK